MNNCYYTEVLGDTQRELVYATPPSGIPYEQKTIAGVNFYVTKKLISNVTVNVTPTTATLGWTGESESYQVRYRRQETTTTELPWTTVPAADDGVTLTGLDANTTYDYQVVCTYGGETYNTPIANFTTIDDMAQPTDLTVSSVTSNTAAVSWNAYAPSYNLRYRKNTSTVLVTLSVPEDVWGDGTGYQMLLDANHNTYGSIIIPLNGSLSEDEDVPAEVYANFEYKIPENADGARSTANVVIENSVTITIPAGMYDWCITNPDPDEGVHIADDYGNVGGCMDDFIFEEGKHYTFTVSYDDGERVDMTVENIYTGGDSPSSQPEEWTTVSGIAATSYTLNGLDAQTTYLVQVQSVKGEEMSAWSDALFTTTPATSIVLLNDGDNSSIIADNNGLELDVTLSGRTLYKNGSWNTLCLPFNMTTDQISADLEGATLMKLSNSSFNEDTGELTINFDEATTIEAGVPYVIKWASGTDLVDPVFHDVVISNTAVPTTTASVDFIGTFSPVVIYENRAKTKLYLGSDNTVYFPTTEDFTVNACRAYFLLKNELTAGDPQTSGVRAFKLNFGDEATGIAEVEQHSHPSSWYTLDGRPVLKGLYIYKGKKVVVK